MSDNGACIDAVLMSSVLSVLDDDYRVDQILEDGEVMLASYSNARAVVVGRLWFLSRNDPRWFLDYELRAEFATTPCWKARFRIRKNVYDPILAVLRPPLTKQLTKF